MTKVDRWVATGLFVVVSTVTLAGASKQGIHRDEAYYMDAGEQYVAYWEDILHGTAPSPLSDATIKRYWSYNHEHPPLWKLLSGISWRLLHECDCAEESGLHPSAGRLTQGRHTTLGLLSESTAFRLPTILAFGLLVALVYSFFVSWLGTRVGALTAALLMACQPRAWFHAQTASFDLPAALLWFAGVYAYRRALMPQASSLFTPGIIFGLFLATKLQSFFLPIALGAHWVWLGILRKRRRLDWPYLGPMVSMLLFAPLVFLGLWPWLWHDTWNRFGAYLAFHWNHVHYNFEYLGANYNRPPYPWHEPLGMLVTTAPVMLLVLAVVGVVVVVRSGPAVRDARGDTTGTRMLILLAALVPVLPFVRGTVPIFGETKHWLATMPYLAIMAGVAVESLGARLVEELRLFERPRKKSAVLAFLVALAVAPAAVETVRSHPYGLSHYNALAGGAPGAADLGMNRQFWGYSVLGLMPWMNEKLPPKTRLYLHDWNHDAYEIYLRDEQLRRDIVDAGMEDPGMRASGAALVIHEKHFNKYEYMIWNAYGHVRPTEVLTLDGVPLVTLYQREAP